MRVLVSTTAGAGHFGPLVPFAVACQDAGHGVLVAAPASFASAVERAGLTHAPFDDVPPEQLGAVFGRLPSLPPEEANAIVIGEVFGRLDAQAALPGVSATIEAWKPDIVLREPCEFASWVAAERAGIPQVVGRIGVAAMADLISPFLEEPMADLRKLAGLSPGGPGPYDETPVVTLVPPTFDGPAADGSPPTWRFRGTAELPAPRLPGEWGCADEPLVYVTFGSVTATVGPFSAVYPAVVDALAGYPARILLTTGEGFDADSLGPLPANVWVEAWWPQAEAMPATAAVVGHGGFGTTMSALAAGLPQVVVPLFASDQFVNGARVAEVGAGICLDGGIAAAGRLCGGLDEVLANPSFGSSARLIAAEIAALPDPSAAVAVFELAAASTPSAGRSA